MASLLVFLPLLVIMPGSATTLAFSINTSSKANQSNSANTNTSSGYQIPFPIPASYTIKYSTYTDQNDSKLNVFTSYFDGSSFYLSNSTLTNSTDSTSNVFFFSPSLLNSVNSVVDYNYFISNNTKFLIFSYVSIIADSLYTNLNIYDLSTNNSILLYSYHLSSHYYISSVNKFSNSPDVYFTVYNTSTILVLKYSFQSNSIVNILTKSSPSSLYTIADVETAILDNKIYISFINENKSYMYIINSQGGISNTIFSNIIVTSFTSTPDGLLLYSSANNSYFNYSYVNDSITPFSTQFSSSLSNSSVILLSPYDNSSFLLLNYDSFSLFNRTSINTYQNTTYFYVYGSQLSVQAITLNGSQYYLLAGLNDSNQFEIYFSSIDFPPAGFNKQTVLTTTTTTSTTTTPTTIPSSTTTNPPPTSPFVLTSSSYSSSAPYTSVSTNFSPVIFLFFLFLLSFGAITIYSKKNRKSQNNYRSGNNSSLQGNQSYQEQRQNGVQVSQTAKKGIRSSCVNCGKSAEPGDVFCLYCGSRL